MEKKMNQDGKKRKRIEIVLSAVILAVFFSAARVRAAESLKTVSVPVYQVFNTNVSSVPAVFKYIMEADADGGTIGGADSCIWEMDGTCVSTIVLTYRHAGVYGYTVKSADTEHRTGYTYEPHTYHLDIYVGQESDGTYQNPVIVIETETGEKTDRLALDPSYAAEPGGGDSGGGSDDPGVKPTSGTGTSTAAESTSAPGITGPNASALAPDGLDENGIRIGEQLDENGIPVGNRLGQGTSGRVPKTSDGWDLVWLIFPVVFMIFIFAKRKRNAQNG
jgi:hypothetical protein